MWPNWESNYELLIVIFIFSHEKGFPQPLVKIIFLRKFTYLGPYLTKIEDV